MSNFIKQQTIPELLAPAGGRAAFEAALAAGADAVYLGLKRFNARARAENFDISDLEELVPLAHAYGMRVLVTLNVVVKQNEWAEMVLLLEDLERIAVDGLIVQDLGLVKLAVKFFPGLRLHASTQMAIHSEAGVAMAKDLGIKRVVLARELTAIELQRIRKAHPRDQVELEAFCHGSLCYAYSGLCFFSGTEDARSGNRGECAYTCRHEYKVLNEDRSGFLFSMKDLDTSDHLDLFINAGMDSLKIEGRKKDAQYVATTVRLYRQELNRLFGFDTLRASAPEVARTWCDGAIKDTRQLLQYSYKREPTTFFLRGRYHESVIDLANTQHRGEFAGTIESKGAGQIVFTTATPLSLHDGLSVSHQGRFIPFGIAGLNMKGRKAFEVPAQTRVSVRLKADDKTMSLPHIGDAVFLSRSTHLKASTTSLCQEARRLSGSIKKFTSGCELDIHIRAQKRAGISVTIWARDLKTKAHLGTLKKVLPITPDSNTCEDVRSKIQSVFKVLGDVKRVATKIRLKTARGTLAIAFSELKQLKRSLIEVIKEESARNERARRQRIEELFSSKEAAHANTDQPLTFVGKFDRIEHVQTMMSFWAARAQRDFKVEIAFEPKRAYLNHPLADAHLDHLLEIVPVKHLTLALPTVIRAWDDAYVQMWINAALKRGVSSFEVGNLGGLKQLQRMIASTNQSIRIKADFSLFALNHLASQMLFDLGLRVITLSVEDDCDNINAHLQCSHRPVDFEAILYKDTPLFIAESCTLTALHGKCPGAQVCGYRTLHVENQDKERFHIAHEGCKSIVYGEKAFGILEERKKFEQRGVRRFRLDFLTRPYDASTIEQILADAVAARPAPAVHSANFRSKLL